jgi:beta-lactamase regulating signal transducer with metallopeptidase domain
VEKKKMLEHITRALYYFQVHLLFASVVGLAAWVLTTIYRVSATTKYWIWVATTVNFLLPVGAILDKVFASRLTWATPLAVIGDAANSVSHSSTITVVWFLGAILMFTRLCFRIRAGRRDDQVAAGESALEPRRNFIADGVPVRFSEAQQAPAVYGFLRPHISLPLGIERLLSEHEFNAVLMHELMHAKRCDNLIRVIHEVGLSLLWFHPLVWISGARCARGTPIKNKKYRAAAAANSAHAGALSDTIGN